jgi:putative transposase
MPRAHRIEIPGGIYHVTAGAIHAAKIFQDDGDRMRWLRLLDLVAKRARWDCCAYCLLSTHYHLVLRLKEPTLARGMQYLNSRHAESCNRRYGRRGHAFGARYHAVLIESASHALEVSRYVALNPVRAGLCAAAEEWNWSSYPATLGIRPAPALLKSEWILGLFAAETRRARRRYREFVDAAGVAS